MLRIDLHRIEFWAEGCILFEIMKLPSDSEFCQNGYSLHRKETLFSDSAETGNFPFSAFESQKFRCIRVQWAKWSFLTLKYPEKWASDDAIWVVSGRWLIPDHLIIIFWVQGCIPFGIKIFSTQLYSDRMWYLPSRNMNFVSLIAWSGYCHVFTFDQTERSSMYSRCISLLVVSSPSETQVYPPGS